MCMSFNDPCIIGTPSSDMVPYSVDKGLGSGVGGPEYTVSDDGTHSQSDKTRCNGADTVDDNLVHAKDGSRVKISLSKVVSSTEQADKGRRDHEGALVVATGLAKRKVCVPVHGLVLLFAGSLRTVGLSVLGGRRGCQKASGSGCDGRSGG